VLAVIKEFAVGLVGGLIMVILLTGGKKLVAVFK
jgi:hypothetical protein